VSERARIYLDYAATAPIKTEVIAAMQAASNTAQFNASSLHAEGRAARALLDEARAHIGELLGASRKEITFTASGTEADHLAITGTVRALGRSAHVVAAAIEHHAVLHALDELRERGCEVTLVPVDAEGRVDPVRFGAALRDDTALACVMYANNEIGSIAPIADLAAIAHERGSLFHTDAVQAPNWLPLDVGRLGIDTLALSAHKFGGPRGVGVLYVRAGTPIVAAIPGGGQEFGRRSGTENVVGIAGAATALELAAGAREENFRRIGGLRDRLEAGVLATIPNVRVNAGGSPRLPSISSCSFAGVDPAAALMRCDLEGLAVSAGSACTSGTLEPSHVIRAIGGDVASATLRFSLGETTTAAEIERVLAILPNAVAALRGTGAGVK